MKKTGIILGLILAEQSNAQLLPKGVGAYSLGYRRYTPDAEFFDNEGVQHPVGDKISFDFSAQGMADGKAGADLQRLYKEMKKFETPGTTSSLANEMNFGQVKGTIKTDVNVEYFGLGYGLGESWTLFGGIPFVSAKVDASIDYSGNNNAEEIKSRLGNLVYKEIQDGLERAAKINGDTVRSKLEDEKGYKPIHHWEYTGVGDTTFGMRTQIKGNTPQTKPFSLGLQTQLDLATGHGDDPDVLTDFPIGRGYNALTLTSDGKATMRYVAVGVKSFVTQGMNTTVSRRIPTEDGETIVSADRKASVNWRPGQDYGASMYLSSNSGYLRGIYSIGTKRHALDHYSGSLAGDYAALAKETNKTQIYHEATVGLTTVNAYLHDRFLVPFILNFTAHDTLSGVNATKETYFELTITSFFATQDAAVAKTTEDSRKSKSALTKS